MSRSLATKTLRPGWALGLGSLAVFLASVSAAITNLALKPMLGELGGGSRTLVWVALAYLVPFAALLPLAGKLADAAGHRKLLLGSLVIYTVGSALGALAYSVPEVLAFRAVQGVGGAGLMISLAWVVTAWQGPRQGFAVGTWRAMLLAGTIGGPPLGGALASWLGWRSTLWLTAPVALVGLALALRYLPEPGRPRGLGGFDWSGASALVVGLAGLVVALSMIGTPQLEVLPSALSVPIVAWGLFALALAAGVFLAVRLRRASWPIVDMSLFRRPGFSAGVAGTLLICVGMFATMFFIPLYLQYQQHYTPVHAAAALVPVAVIALAVGIASGAITDRWGPVIPSMAGFALLVAGFVVFAQLSSSSLGVALTATSMASYREAFWFSVGYAVLGMLVSLRLTPARHRLPRAWRSAPVIEPTAHGQPPTPPVGDGLAQLSRHAAHQPTDRGRPR